MYLLRIIIPIFARCSRVDGILLRASCIFVAAAAGLRPSFWGLLFDTPTRDTETGPKKWYFDKLYAETIYQNVLYLSYNPLYTVFDKGIFNILGPRVLTNTLEKLSMHVSEMQTGFFYHYALIFLISLTILIMISSINFFILLIILFILFFFIFKKENK